MMEVLNECMSTMNRYVPGPSVRFVERGRLPCGNSAPLLNAFQSMFVDGPVSLISWVGMPELKAVPEANSVTSVVVARSKNTSVRLLVFARPVPANVGRKMD